MIAESYSLFKKDFHSELRTRYAINSLAMFIIVAISVILFSIGNETINESLTAGLFWVVIFFTAMSGLVKSFCFRRGKRYNSNTSTNCFSNHSFFGQAHL